MTRIFLGAETVSGDLQMGHNVDIGYYAQNQADELDGNLTVLETLDAVAVGDVRKQLRALLGAFLFSGEDVDKKVKVLSGGEKARLALCKLLLHPYNLLILDEPTNHLDIASKEVLKDALMSYDGTLIVVSHDRDFLSSMTELVYEVTPIGLKEYIGDIRAFLHEKHATSIRAYEAGKRTAPPIAKAPSAPTPVAAAAPPPASKELKRLKNQVSTLEQQVAEKEAELQRIHDELSGLDGSDRNRMTDLAYAHERAEKELEQTMGAWEAAVLEVERLEAGA